MRLKVIGYYLIDAMNKRTEKIKTYSRLPYTEYFRASIKADTLSQLFASGLEAMSQILRKNYKEILNGHATIFEISLTAEDTTTLFINFLSEVLTLSHLHKNIFYDVNFLEISENTIHALVVGSKLDYFTQDIKEVTYAEANVRKDMDGKWETMILFDI